MEKSGFYKVKKKELQVRKSYLIISLNVKILMFYEERSQIRNSK
jgi:hypothetical protein